MERDTFFNLTIMIGKMMININRARQPAYAFLYFERLVEMEREMGKINAIQTYEESSRPFYQIKYVVTLYHAGTCI